jgi:hypothetical protein
VHSLAYMLSMFEGVMMYFVAPKVSVNCCNVHSVKLEDMMPMLSMFEGVKLHLVAPKVCVNFSKCCIFTV